MGDFARDLGSTWIRWLLLPSVPPLLLRRYAAALERWQKAYNDYGVGEPFAAAVFAGRHGWDANGPPELVAVKLDLLEGRGDDQDFLALALRAGEIRRYALCQIRHGEIDAGLAAFSGGTFDDRDVLDVAEALVAAEYRARAFSFALGVARQPLPLLPKHAWNAFDRRPSPRAGSPKTPSEAPISQPRQRPPKRRSISASTSSPADRAPPRSDVANPSRSTRTSERHDRPSSTLIWVYTFVTC